MDSLTHIVLGACVGELILDKQAGRKAILWGALAQSVPDIDFIAGMWMPVSTELLAHRGITHSFLFAFLAAFFLALIAARWHKAEPISLRKWFWFFLIEIGCHLFLDAMNNYGIGWFEPFTSQRISFNVLYVADPLFTIVALVSFLFLLFAKTDHKYRLRWARVGVFASLLYLSFALFNKFSIDKKVQEEMVLKGKVSNRYFTTPTLFNNFLWFVAIEDSAGYQIGYRSILENKVPIKTTYFPKNEKLLDPVNDHKEVLELKTFSQGYYTVENWGDTLVFNDLRFGQTNGWEDPKSRFAFHYYLSHPTENDLIVQRGRFAKFNQASALIMWDKILGK
ncbi:MAG: metal-dependent hydrolase [Chitinophagaceae bacterium]|jgi:inner membrane protein